MEGPFGPSYSYQYQPVLTDKLLHPSKSGCHSTGSSELRFDQFPMPDLNEYMSTDEAAKLLGFHVQSVRYMVNNQTLEGIKVGRSWLVSRESVKEYLEKTRSMSKHDPRRGKGAS